MKAHSLNARAWAAIAIAMAFAMVCLMTGCSSSSSSDSSTSSNASSTSSSATSSSASSEKKTVTITSLNASKEATQLEVPYDPQRIAILDLASLDILDNLGLGDRVVGTADTSIDYLEKYANDSNLAKLGTIKEADLEAVAACEPDVIFIGGRLATQYDELSKIAPVVFLATDTDAGLVKSVEANATTIASMFGLEDQVADKMAGFSSRISALSEFAQGKTALIGMATSGSFNLLGNNSRCSLIVNEVGFDNIGASAASSSGHGGGSGSSDGSGSRRSDSSSSSESGSPHGNESSFETLTTFDPDYIFVLDRDKAIGTNGAQLAQDLMNNEIVNSMRAAQENHIVYLEHPAVWYTAEGGITALDYMITDLETALL